MMQEKTAMKSMLHCMAIFDIPSTGIFLSQTNPNRKLRPHCHRSDIASVSSSLCGSIEENGRTHHKYKEGSISPLPFSSHYLFNLSRN